MVNFRDNAGSFVGSLVLRCLLVKLCFTALVLYMRMEAYASQADKSSLD